MIHTAEGARNVTALGNYFAQASVQASSHVGIDDVSVETYVPYSEAAWTILSANGISDNAELCGFAAWTRTQWLTEHPHMLELAAQWIRERCTARGIPIRKLTPAQVGQGMAGVIGHVDWTLGMHDGTHTDPGVNFPWDVVIGLATGGTPAATSEGDTELNADQDNRLKNIEKMLGALKPGVVLPARSANANPRQDDAFGASLNAWAEASNARAGIEALAKRLTSGPVAGPAALSDADVQRVAAAVVKLLGTKTVA